MKNYKVTITGSIRDIPLSDVLQLLASTQKTGILEVAYDYDTGHIVFKKGVVNHAYFENYPQPPKIVVYSLLGLSEGNFEFHLFKESDLESECKNTINMQVPFLLMEAAQYEDETSMDIDIIID